MTHTGIQISMLHEMCRETLNPYIGTVTFNSNVQIVFESNIFMTFNSLPYCFEDPLCDVMH